MRYRVDELAARSGLSVDTIRFYQSKGLVPQPEREGRLAWYDDGHLERLARVRDLKAKGFTLRAIERLLAGDLDPADAALVSALPGAGDPDDGAAVLTLDEFAERSGMSPSLIEAIAREGLLTPQTTDAGDARFTVDDLSVVRAGLELLEAGLPLSELLALARDHDAAMRGVAERAVDMFLRFVRDPIRGSATSDDEAAAGLVNAFQKMLPATTSLVSHHFRRVLLEEARRRVEGAVEEASA